MSKPKKPSAAERTVDMFSAPKPLEVPVEAEEKAEHGDRVSLEADVDRLREEAFKVQEWTSKAFGDPDADSNQYRISLKGDMYYLETLSKEPGKPAYGYTGVFVREKDLFAFATVIVAAVRAKQAQGTSHVR